MKEWDEESTQVAERPDVVHELPRDRAYLIVIQGGQVGEMFKLSESDPIIIGRGGEAEVRLVEDKLSRRHAKIAIERGTAYIEDLGSTNGTFINGTRLEDGERVRLVDGDKVQLGAATILKFTYHDRVEEDFQKQMYESALRDGLTKIYNKRYFIERVQTEFAYSKRHGSWLSLVMIDLDHFKAINDEHGHVAGDHVLATLADHIARQVRNEDVFARFGGEEFAVLCRGTDIRAAQVLAERVRRTVERHPFTAGRDGPPITVTISAGVAAIPDTRIQDPEGLVNAADEALYEAKHGGRNRVHANAR